MGFASMLNMLPVESERPSRLSKSNRRSFDCASWERISRWKMLWRRSAQDDICFLIGIPAQLKAEPRRGIEFFRKLWSCALIQKLDCRLDFSRNRASSKKVHFSASCALSGGSHWVLGYFFGGVAGLMAATASVRPLTVTGSRA
jgi:hypothetical protein